ncbi:hypothetical protein PRIPAC_82606 [Pristionchus pacificus]|uniref:Uncharacterized protein n=1 Tax=Pristionchus pacificus TaxID=54126 RepID=A0A2A6CLW5_PRIPA|nr:hypothetical protein PRIPAC_82606 [Pristionchus pacificus]|eukprot:PDM79088.1 hypothetical protein PRIPAC_31667 [Pristionchus pacificus]
MAPSLQVRDFKKDVVYLFQFPGNETASSMSPYCVKVEAFCRLHNLKFERRNTFSERGDNGLLPFIELNGVQICESQVILNRLAEHFGLKNYEDARAEGIGHSLERMIENHTLHLLRIDLNRTLPDLVKVIVKQRVPGFAVDAVSSLGASYMRKKTRGGVKDAIGQFTAEEYDKMLRNDMIQLQNVLGANQFLMGASPTRVDCLALAHIGHSYFRLPQSRSYIHELVDSAELSVFKQYLERTVKTIFGDNFNNKE